MARAISSEKRKRKNSSLPSSALWHILKSRKNSVLKNDI
jgi:hypothetical protein